LFSGFLHAVCWRVQREFFFAARGGGGCQSAVLRGSRCQVTLYAHVLCHAAQAQQENKFHICSPVSARSSAALLIIRNFNEYIYSFFLYAR